MRSSFPYAGPRFGLLLVMTLGLIFCAPDGEAQLFGSRRDSAPRPLTEEEIGVPFPKTGRVQAVKGQEVRFEIEAISKAPGAAVEFLIRTMPTAGRIVSLIENPNARNRAIVTYYADPSTSAEADVFGFAVRYRGGRYSSEMRFDIDLVDVRAEIQSEPEIDFGQTLVGEEVVREIPVRNLGTGEFRRQIYLTSPWRIVEPQNGLLSIGPKQTRMVKVGFRPTMVGDTSYFLSFSRTKGAMTKMTGAGTPPFALGAAEAELTLDPLTGARAGEVAVENRTGKPLRLSLRGSSRIQEKLPEMILVSPEKPYAVPVEIPSFDTAPFDGMLQLYQESGYSVSARLVAAVVPGKLEITIPNSLASDVINYGRVGAGGTSERGFRVTNVGGVAVPLEFHIPAPFRLLSDPGPQLAPGASVNLAIGIFPARSGKGPVDVTMSVLGLDQDLPVRLLANVIPAEGGDAGNEAGEGVLNQLGRLRVSSGKANREAGNSFVPPEVGNNVQVATETVIGNRPEKNGKGESATTEFVPHFDISPLLEREYNAELRAPEDLTVVEATSGSLTVGWTAPPNSELSRFDIEFMGMMQDPETGFPQAVWVPIEGVEFERVGRLVKAEIDDLSPYSSYQLRVFTVDENGRASVASAPMTASTELPMDWTYIYLALLLLFLGALGFGVWKVIRQRRREVYQAKYADA